MTPTILLHDKRFRLYMTAEEIDQKVRHVAADISRDYGDKDPLLCPVLTGSCMFFADLARHLTIDPDIAFVRYSSYSGLHSTGKVKASLPFSEKCRGRHVIIVEDIVDTGISMEFMLHELSLLNPASVKVCTFLTKPDNLVKQVPIDYCCASIPNDFIVGYGLDYNEKGRTYKDLYIIDE